MCLWSDEVTAGEGIFEHRNDGVAVVRRLWTNVLKCEGKYYETARAHVQLGHGVVFVQDGGDASEG